MKELPRKEAADRLRKWREEWLRPRVEAAEKERLAERDGSADVRPAAEDRREDIEDDFPGDFIIPF